MTVGILSLRLLIPGARSLKDRRRALRSIKDRLRNRFNVSVAEVDDPQRWQSAELGVCAVGNDRGYVEGLLDEVVSLVRRDRHVELLRSEKEFV